MSAINSAPNSSLLQWLATFQLDGKDAIQLGKDAFYNLADGYICARILNQISPLYFTDKWLDGIKPVPPNGSWRLRVSNLKRILQKVHDYASDLQSPQFRSPSALTPDVAVIAQNFDPDQICRLIQLILLCAINCDKKQEYIEKIRLLPTEVKQDIKEAIEELLVKNADEVGSTNRIRRDSSKDYETDSVNSSQRLNISATSENATASPLRSTHYRQSGIIRRNSSQADLLKKNDSHLDTSQNLNSDQQNETLDEVRQKLNAAITMRDEKAQAFHELESKLKQVQMERDQLAFENDRLIKHQSSTPTKNSDSRRLSRGSLLNEQDIDSTSSSKRSSNVVEDKSHDLVLQQNRRLQSEIQRLKEDVMRIETEKEDYRLKSNLLKEDLDRITSRHEELRNKAQQVQRLQDELDEHKQISEKVVHYETMLNNLVNKNAELKKDLKNNEEKNLVHVQNIVKLEEENNQLKSAINQIEIYKKQLNETRIKLSQETHRADKAEVEQSRLSERLQTLKGDCDKLFQQYNRRRSTSSDDHPEKFSQNKIFESVNSKVNCPSSQSNFSETLNLQSKLGDSSSSMPTSTIELRERIARLEAENEVLQAKLNTKVETNKSALEALLEETTEKCKRLEIDNRQSRKKIMILESNIKDLISSSGQLPSTSSAMLFQQESSSDNVLALMKRVEDLQRVLYQREQELRDSEAKYKKNIQKAKEVVNALKTNLPLGGSLHPSCLSTASSFNSNSLEEISLLKQQLREREESFIALEREFHEFKKLKEVHERLILSAFYGLTTPLQWKNAEKRLERTTLTSPPNTASSSININSKHSH